MEPQADFRQADEARRARERDLAGLQAQVHHLSTPALLKALSEELRELTDAERRIAQGELSEAKQQATSGGATLGLGAFLLGAGFLWLMGSAIAALALVLQIWAAALIIGGGVFIIGGVIALWGWSRLRRMKLQETLTSLKENRRWATETLRGIRSNVRGAASA